jgi:MYXO-CTERM domain-containing protein
VTRARAAAALAAVALGALARPAAAYVRTTDRSTGVSVAWPLPVVAYDLGSAPSFPSPTCAAGPAGDPLEEAVRASFSAWEPGCADGSPPALRLVYGGRIPELRTGFGATAENVVVMRNGWCAANPQAVADPCYRDPDVDCGGIYNCFDDDGAPANRSTVALTTVLYDPKTGRLYDADMELVGWDGVKDAALTGSPHGFYFTCDEQPGWPACTTYGEASCWGYDLQNTVTHEADHVIGLAHPCGDPGAPSCQQDPPAGEVPFADRTMYPTTAAGETSKRTLSADDVAGVCAIYPPSSGCGCGSGGSPGVLAAAFAALALLALRPRRRRVR